MTLFELIFTIIVVIAMMVFSYNMGFYLRQWLVEPHGATLVIVMACGTVCLLFGKTFGDLLKKARSRM